MTACVSSSMELTARATGLGYLSKDNIFTHPSCPAATRDAFDRLALPSTIDGAAKNLVPDDLFGLAYRGSKPSFRFFAVEIDRNTESIERKNPGQSSFGAKLRAYLEAMKSQSYRLRWGVPNLLVLTITTNVSHLDNLCRSLNALSGPELLGRFLFAALPEFGANWRVPRVKRELLALPWVRADGSHLAIDKP